MTRPPWVFWSPCQITPWLLRHCEYCNAHVDLCREHITRPVIGSDRRFYLIIFRRHRAKPAGLLVLRDAIDPPSRIRAAESNQELSRWKCFPLARVHLYAITCTHSCEADISGARAVQWLDLENDFLWIVRGTGVLPALRVGPLVSEQITVPDVRENYYSCLYTRVMCFEKLPLTGNVTFEIWHRTRLLRISRFPSKLST